MTDRLTQLIQAVEEADSSKLLLEAVQNLADAQLVGAIPILIEALSYNNPGAAVASVDGVGDPRFSWHRRSQRLDNFAWCGDCRLCDECSSCCGQRARDDEMALVS